MVYIKTVEEMDREYWMSIDTHTTKEGFELKVNGQLGYVIHDGEEQVGILHYLLLWDNMPFLNFIYVENAKQRNGYGKSAMECWEAEMKKKGYPMALLSTQVDEEAQHFYRKLGYKECGSLIINEGPLKQPMEMFMYKML